MNSDRPDQLLDLLPAVYRLRDADAGLPLQALLRVIGEQAQVAEQDIQRLYENWFIETCDPWVVPYLGDLVGVSRPAIGRGEQDELESRRLLRQRLLNPRREVANAVNHHRRKGTLAVLEDLANAIADWPARAVELYPLVTQCQSLRAVSRPTTKLESHRRTAPQQEQPGIGRLVNLRDPRQVAQVGTPFDEVAHLPDMRSPSGQTTRTIYHPSGVALYVWRLRVYPLTETTAKPLCHQHAGDQAVCFYTFEPRGLHIPLYIKPERETDPTAIAQEWNLPRRLSIASLRDSADAASPRYYGRRKSLAVFVPDGSTPPDTDGYVPREQVLPLDLTPYRSQERIKELITKLKDKRIAVDPEHGMLAVLGGSRLVRASFHYAVAGEVGGGEYLRALDPVDLRQAAVHRLRALAERPAGGTSHAPSLRLACYLTSAQAAAGTSPSARCGCGSAQSRVPVRRTVLIEICDSSVYELDAGAPADCSNPAAARDCTILAPNTDVIIRAGQGCRPVISLPFSVPRQAWKVQIPAGSSLTLDGIVLEGGPLVLEPVPDQTGRASAEQSVAADCSRAPDPARPRLVLRHSTLTPLLSIPPGCGDSAGLVIKLPGSCVTIDHSVTGAIHGCVLPQDSIGPGPPDGDPHGPATLREPIQLFVRDSIVDGQFLPAAIDGESWLALNVERSTILGAVRVRELLAGQDSLFDGEVRVQRRQSGGLRFCYVPPLSGKPEPQPKDWQWSTPRQYYCQPALEQVSNTNGEATSECGCPGRIVTPQDPCAADTQARTPAEKIRPRFTSDRYGDPGYCQLALDCCPEIRRGAEDESELGVFHDLYEPQREANLRVRLVDFLPASMQLQLLFADEKVTETRS